MDIAILPLSILVMFVTLLISIIPFIPGPLLLWGLGLLFAWLNGFERVTILAVIIMTLFMLGGITSDLWLRALGMKVQGTSCWATGGSLIGGLIGTGIMPIIGTIIGALIGALLVEMMRLGDLQQAVRAGRSAMTLVILGMMVEFTASTAIFLTYITSIWITA